MTVLPLSLNFAKMKIHFQKTFYSEKATFLLTLQGVPGIEERVQEVAKAKGLSQKEEFHFTIIGHQTGEEILARVAENDGLFEKFRKLIEESQFQISLQDEYYFIEKEYEEGEVRKSVIQLASLEGLEDFYRQLNALFGTSFSVPFPHLTLFTTSTKPENNLRGIGIYSQEDLLHKIYSEKLLRISS